jgi:hypothetical protein
MTTHPRHGRNGITRGVSFCNGLFFIVLGLSYIADDGKGLTSGISGQASCLDYMWVPWACVGLRGGPVALQGANTAPSRGRVSSLAGK